MRQIFSILAFIFFAASVFAQSPNTPPILFSSRFQITNAVNGTGDTIVISGYTDDCTTRFSNSDIAIGDSLYVLEGTDLLIFGVVTTRTISLGIATFKVRDFNGAGLLPSNGQAAIFRPTTDYDFPGYVCGLNDGLQQYISDRFRQNLDAALAAGSTDSTIYATVYSRDTAAAAIRGEIAALAQPPFDSSDIATGGIGNTDLAADIVTASKIAADAVGSSEIAANAVGNSEMADNAIGSAEIIAESIQAADIDTGAVTTAEILDATVAWVDLAQEVKDSINAGGGGESTTGGSGTTLNGSAIDLGGTLTGATTIVGNSQDYTETGLKYYNFEADSAIWKLNGQKFLHLGSIYAPTYPYGTSLSLGYRALESAPNYGQIANTAIGGYALQNLGATGRSNIGIGYSAGNLLTTGSYNTIVGVAAMANCGTGADANIAIGHHALRYNEGDYNLGIGQSALEFNTTGINNTSSGQESMKANTTGSRNTAYGVQALSTNTTNNDNTAIGFQSLFVANPSALNNTAIGSFSQSGITTGGFNTSLGSFTFQLASTMNHSVAVGNTAGRYSNPSSSGFNVFIGSLAGTGNSGGTSTGDNNVGVGYKALNAYTTGTENSILGSNAGDLMTTGSRNNAFGSEALGSLTTGSDNLGVGRQAGNTLTTGSRNINIGTNATSSANSATDELNIGFTLFGTGFNISGVSSSNGKLGINTQTPAATWHPLWHGANSANIQIVERKGRMSTSASNTLIGEGIKSQEALPTNRNTTETVVTEREISYTDTTLTNEDVSITQRLIADGVLSNFDIATKNYRQLGNYKFNTDQTVGAGQDDYLMTWNNSSGEFEAQALVAAQIPDLAATYWKLGGQTLAANANIGSTSAHRFGITTNGVPRVYYSSDGRVYSGTVTDWVFSSSDTSSSKGAVAIFGTTGANSAQLVAGDTVRVKLSSTTLEMENNRTGNQTVILADRTTAPAVGGYSSIDIGLANTVTTSLRSYHEVNGTGYSAGLHTLSSGITNTTPAWYATHLNKFAVNRDTATWCLDVKGSGTDALLARFEANDENAFMYLQNSSTGNATTDGLSISMANSDATIYNREAGGGITVRLDTNIQNFQQATGTIAIDGRMRVTVSSAGTLTLDHATATSYVFSGTTTTWTLPAVSGNTEQVFYIKNRGSGAITLNDGNGGADEIYNTAAGSSLTINAGEAYILLNDGTYWVAM